MRDPRDKFRHVDMVISAAGLKITSPDLEGVIAGSPLYGIAPTDDEEKIKNLVESEVKSVIINTDSNGIILKMRHYRFYRGNFGNAKKREHPNPVR